MGVEECTRLQAAAMIGASKAAIIRLEKAGKLTVRWKNGLRRPIVVFDLEEVRRVASTRALLPSTDETVLLLGPAVRELGSLGFCDEHGNVSSASILSAATRIRSKLRELRAREVARLEAETLNTDPIPVQDNGCQNGSAEPSSPSYELGPDVPLTAAEPPPASKPKRSRGKALQRGA